MLKDETKERFYMVEGREVSVRTTLRSPERYITTSSCEPYYATFVLKSTIVLVIRHCDPFHITASRSGIHRLSMIWLWLFLR